MTVYDVKSTDYDKALDFTGKKNIIKNKKGEKMKQKNILE